MARGLLLGAGTVPRLLPVGDGLKAAVVTATPRASHTGMAGMELREA